METGNNRSLFVHILPFLHLVACLSIALVGVESAWRYLFWIDAPASAFILALGLQPRSPIASIWDSRYGMVVRGEFSGLVVLD